jgi:alkylation response protein AidB-like acyl-CoA dehydrogenase
VELRPSEEQQQLRDALRRLFERRLAELVDRLPDPPVDDAARDLADALAVGLPGLGLPEDVGGAGTFADLVVAHEELGRGLAGPLFTSIAASGRLLLHATGEGRDTLLAAIADGSHPDALVVEGDSVVAGPDIRLAIDATGLAAYRSEVAILAAARQLGGGRAVVERTIEHVRTRKQFDRAIGTFQAVQHQLADIATELDATELTVAQGAWAVDAGLPTVEVRRLAAIAALTAAAAFRRATLVAHQLHGGMGFVLDSPLHLWSTRAITDPTAPMARAELLDDLADACGITADGIVTPPDHRVSL